MRPQPERTGPRKQLSYSPARVNGWVEWAVPLADETAVEPVRTITLDARLGEALLRLAAIVHFQLAAATGWLEGGRTPEECWREDPGAKARRCQTVVTDGSRQWVLFAPAKPNPSFFLNYTARFNADGWRPFGPFPIRTNLPGIDLRGVTLVLVNQPGSVLKTGAINLVKWWSIRGYWQVRLHHANLKGAAFVARPFLRSHRFRGLLDTWIADARIFLDLEGALVDPEYAELLKDPVPKTAATVCTSGA